MTSTTTINGRQLFEIQYRTSPRGKVRTAYQWHRNAEEAGGLVLIRDNEPGAVAVSVREMSDAESLELVSGRTDRW